MSTLETHSPPQRASGARTVLIGALLVVLAVAAFLGYRWLRGEGFGIMPSVSTPAASVEQRLLVVEQQLERLERERVALQERMSEAGKRTNLMRDEVLAIGERAALMEDSVRELSRHDISTQDSLRLSEAELLLTIARERWLLSGDLSGAIQATEMAGNAINTLKDPKWVNLRQTIAQELVAFRTVEADPRAIARGELDALEALLPQLPSAHDVNADGRAGEYGAKRLLNALIRIQPTGEQTLIAPMERQAAKTALALEMTNARSALQLRRSSEFKGAVLRMNIWLQRLYVQTPELKAQRTRLLALANAPLTAQVPLAGSTLQELQRLKQGDAP